MHTSRLIIPEIGDYQLLQNSRLFLIGTGLLADAAFAKETRL